MFVDGTGHARFSISYAALRARLFGNRHFNFMRGELVHIIRARLSDPGPIRFRTIVDSFHQNQDSVSVPLSDGTNLVADLLVAADGVHSRTRTLAFGEEAQFAWRLGYYMIGFVLTNLPNVFGFAQDVVTLTTPNRQMTIYPHRDSRRATFFFIRLRTLFQILPPPQPVTSW